ncbi:MAG: AbrB/MazE/SpoVT family DNA-binding domain-containing protein [Nitrososphaerales archaeon]
MQANNSSSKEKIRTKISKGYQVVVPSQLRKRYKVSVGDEVLWEISNKGVSIQVRKKPSLGEIVGLGHSRKRASSVELKKRIQRGDL